MRGVRKQVLGQTVSKYTYDSILNLNLNTETSRSSYKYHLICPSLCALEFPPQHMVFIYLLHLYIQCTKMKFAQKIRPLLVFNDLRCQTSGYIGISNLIQQLIITIYSPLRLSRRKCSGGSAAGFCIYQKFSLDKIYFAKYNMEKDKQ